MTVKKRLLTLSLGISMIASSAVAFAMTQQDAKNLANSYVPADAQYSHITEDKHDYDVFYRTTTDLYEVEVDKNLGRVTSLSIDKLSPALSTDVKISAEDAKAIVTQAYPNANITRVKLDRDGYKTTYDVDFILDGAKCDMEILAADGTVLETEIDYVK